MEMGSLLVMVGTGDERCWPFQGRGLEGLLRSAPLLPEEAPGRSAARSLFCSLTVGE